MKKGLVTVSVLNAILIAFLNIFIWIGYGGTPAIFVTAVSMLFFSVILFVIDRLNREAAGVCHEAVVRTDSATIDMLSSLHFPCVLFDDKGKVLWYNRIGADFAESEEVISSLSENDGSISLGNCVYDYSVIKCGKDKELNFAVFSDVTGFKQISEKLDAQKGVVCYITVDNYSDVTDGISANEAGKITVETEEKMVELAESVSGVVHKLERDRYLLFMDMEHLVHLMTERFSILSSVKQIKASNDIPVTISIGVGCSDESTARSASFAKSAMELALGRGGDQAVVKIGDEFRFFGGSSKEHEKKTKVRSRVMAQALCELVRNAGQVLIMGHINPDADSFGAAIGIFRIAQSMGVRARIIIDGSNTAVVREIERFREISEYSFAFINAEKALSMINDKTLIVVVDTHVASRCEASGLLNLTSKIAVIDHHRRSAEFIKNTLLSYHEPSASSTCEMVTEILQYTDFPGQLSKPEAEALFAGIILDTKNFTMKTGARTFDAAAYLKKCGADTDAVRELFKTNIDAYKKRCRIVASAVDYRSVTVLSVAYDTDVEICAQASDELLNVSGIKASFVVCENDGVHISARSNGEINVQIIAEMLGGGGHMTVAGVQLGCTAEEAVAQLKNAIDSYFAEYY